LADENGRATFLGGLAAKIKFTSNEAMFAMILSGIHGECHSTSKFFLLCID